MDTVSLHRKEYKAFNILLVFKTFYLKCLEAHEGQLILWFPVFFAIGIGGYFSLPSELPIILGAFPVLIAFSICYLAPKAHSAKIVSLLFLTVACGFFAAQARTFMVHTPILSKKIGPVIMVANVQSIELKDEDYDARLIF